ncbi:hypothetical protein AVEN_257172-1, partial [Araneus ventricosus]
RPDIIVQFENQILIIDITVTFEDEPDAFDRARERKKVRYNALLDLFKTPTNHVEIFAFVMGALGSWDPQNDILMRKFVTRSYLNLFRKLCTSDTIRWSRDIYVEHITGVRQFDPTQLTNDLTRPQEPTEDDPLYTDINNAQTADNSTANNQAEDNEEATDENNV